jgi:hypothetical protein
VEFPPIGRRAASRILIAHLIGDVLLHRNRTPLCRPGRAIERAHIECRNRWSTRSELPAMVQACRRSAPQRLLASFESDTDDRKSQNRTERKSAGRCPPLDSAGAPAARRQAPGAFGLVASGETEAAERSVARDISTEFHSRCAMLVNAQRNSPSRAGELEAGSMIPLLTKVNRPFCFCVKPAGVMTRLAGFADSSDFGTGRVTKRALGESPRCH